LIAAGLLSAPRIPQDSPLDFTLDFAAWWVFVAAAGLRLLATLFIGGRKGQVVAQHGPYSICRNPLYVANLGMALAAVLWVQSLTAGAGLLLGAWAYLSLAVPAEEKRLAQRLGAPYQAYLARVPRYWPRLSYWSVPATLEIDVRCLLIELKRAPLWLLVPPVALALAAGRAAEWWPCLWYWP
jgi:protein-S-isoprenylcysteine O-methyltransferase Ste14